MEDEADHIDFLVKYKDWIAIKRMTIRDTTTPQEIAYHLSGIRTSSDSRTYKILGIKTEVLDGYVDTVAATMKKNLESLGSAIAGLKSAEAKRVVAESCPKELEDVALCYLVGKFASALNSPAAVDQLLLSKIYKELKPPKGVGRKKKGK